MLAIILALAAAVQPAPPPRDPKSWPTPVMDSTPPAIPQLRRGAVLVLSKTNGFRNEEQIVAANVAIEQIAKEVGRDAFVTENAAVMNPSDLTRFSVIVLNSASGNLFTEPQRAAFRDWVERGGGVVLLHGAGDGSHEWPWFGDSLLDARFIGHTAQPEQFQEARIDVVEPDHPVMRGVPRRWERVEEWYSFDKLPQGNGTRILATVDESTYKLPERLVMGRVHPMVWTRCVAKGRSVFSALGHHGSAYAEPAHRRLIGNAIEWAAGKNC